MSKFVPHLFIAQKVQALGYREDSEIKKITDGIWNAFPDKARYNPNHIAWEFERRYKAFLELFGHELTPIYILEHPHKLVNPPNFNKISPIDVFGFHLQAFYKTYGRLPNRDKDGDTLAPKNMNWQSVYWRIKKIDPTLNFSTILQKHDPSYQKRKEVNEDLTVKEVTDALIAFYQKYNRLPNKDKDKNNGAPRGLSWKTVFKKIKQINPDLTPSKILEESGCDYLSFSKKSIQKETIAKDLKVFYLKNDRLPLPNKDQDNQPDDYSWSFMVQFLKEELGLTPKEFLKQSYPDIVKQEEFIPSPSLDVITEHVNAHYAYYNRLPIDSRDKKTDFCLKGLTWGQIISRLKKEQKGFKLSQLIDKGLVNKKRIKYHLDLIEQLKPIKLRHKFNAENLSAFDIYQSVVNRILGGENPERIIHDTTLTQAFNDSHVLDLDILSEHAANNDIPQTYQDFLQSMLILEKKPSPRKILFHPVNKAA